MRANSIDVERGQNTLSIRMRSCAVYKSFVCNCDYQACARLQGVCNCDYQACARLQGVCNRDYQACARLQAVRVSVRMCFITYIVHVGERRRKWAH